MKAYVLLAPLLLLVVLLITGWVKNIILLSECDFEAPYKAEVIRTVGIIPVVGMVTGWIEIDD